MDEKSKQLFIAGSEAFRSEVAPIYSQLRQELLANLALEGASRADLVEQSRQETANAKLVKEFVKALPRAKSGRFDLEHEYEIRAIQGSVIWSGQWHKLPSILGRGYYDYKPFFIVGKAFTSTYLLASANSQSDLYVFYPSKRIERRLKDIPSQAFSPLSPQECRRLFDQYKHTFTVGPSTPGSTCFKNLLTNSNHWCLNRLSDAELARFDVHSQLNTLASLFQKEATLDSLVAAYEP